MASIESHQPLLYQYARRRTFSAPTNYVWRFDWLLMLLLGAENFGFGLGFTVMNFYMFRMAAGSKYPASFVALNASVIYLSYLLFGAVSGVIQESVGYAWLFFLSIIVSIPAFFAIPFLNYKLDEREK